MQARALKIAAVLIWWLPVGAAAGEIPCWCRDAGGQHPLGTVLCLKVDDKERLVRCERVQNNTSWRVLSEGCPTAEGPRAQVSPIARFPDVRS